MSQPQELSDLLENRRWKALIAWLGSKGFDYEGLCVEPQTRDGAGRGLFATRPLEPSSVPFIRIPAAALLNSRTLKVIYPGIALEGFRRPSSSGELVINGTQLLSIYLSVNRPEGDEESENPHFGPYISTFPRDFSSHPLSWIVKQELGTAGYHELFLLQDLPPSVLSELQAVAKRFWDDWKVALQRKDVFQKIMCTGKQIKILNVDDFLWGWLTVNTRCIYSKIFTENLPLSNLTMCPIIDLANHTVSTFLPQLIPQATTDNVWATPEDCLLKPCDFTFLTPAQAVDNGNELYLKYGGHCNRTLFVEYGFVDEHSDHAGGEVDVSDLVCELILQKTAGKEIKGLLDTEGYLSELDVYAFPAPVHPSWRLLCALRLANLNFPVKFEMADVDNVMQSWRNVTMGIADFISEDNEFDVRNDLGQICDILLTRSADGVRRLQDDGESTAGGCPWYGWAKASIVKLWEEEEHVARALVHELGNGCENSSPTPQPFLFFMGQVSSWLPSPAAPKLYTTDSTLLRLKDGGTLGVDATPPGHDRVVPDNTPIIVVLHGLTGGSHEAYVRAILAQAVKPKKEGGLGYRGIVVNFRGCAGVPLTSGQLYSAGHTDDLRQALVYISHRYPKAPLIGVGFSLGAGVITRYLAQEGVRSRLRSACILSCPWNLLLNSERMEGSFFLRNVYSKAMATNLVNLIKRHIPAINKLPENRMTPLIPKLYALKNPTLIEFDSLVTRTIGGSSPPFPLPSARAYYEWASSDHCLKDIRVPLLALNADDDPVVGHLPLDIGNNGYVALVVTAGGGHLGWFEEGMGKFFRRWITRPVLEWLRAVCEDVNMEPSQASQIVEDGEWLVEVGREELGVKVIGDVGEIEGIEGEGGLFAGL
ncbi:hypothetical protein EW145_g4942 [Phellinidium pouzarii]|uniref:AB hydrolase-1 domain-containing protein n=1 Tax=Phellinidium pouzarii TaxID=167371 RepID=A0A4S4L3L7_9AGAM|nr:hypothetical protein EW145_g4942 [Phellinidium pouzarii]